MAGHADGADVVDVVDAQVDAAGAGGLGQAVVGVVLLAGEDLEPVPDQALGHGLGADVHEAPLGQLVVGRVDLALLDGEQDVLRPGHEQPHDGAALVRHGAQDRLGGHAAQQDRAAANQEAAEPVHEGSRVVERRDAQEHVVVGLRVVVLLHLRGLRERAVRVQDRLGEAGGAAGEVDRGVIGLADGNHRVRARAHGREQVVVLREGGAVLADVEQQAAARDLVCHALDSAGELGAKHQDVDVGQAHAVVDLLGGVAEVEGHHHGAALEHAEVDGQPLDTVHQQDGDLVALAHAARGEQVGKAVGLLVEHAPRDLATIGIGCRSLD